MSLPASAPNVGRFTALVLGLVVFICVVMIGGTGYLKFQLDRSEVILAAPDNALGSDQDLFDRLRRDWGYGGFLGLAQAYVSTHDASGFAEMKAHIKSADDIVAHLPDKTPAETRHELAAIGEAFDTALKKLSAPTGEMGGEFTSADLAPLYAALPILDARVTGANAETRLAAQNKIQFWAMLLTLVSWCSLIIAAACAAGIYLTLRDKHSAPMRALAQSIQNMAQGDMRTAIWGIERQDMIGELARAVDIARYQFSHLPDLSLLSDQGPVRMRFEGGTRSLFEAMMRAISTDSENIRSQSIGLTETIAEQKEAITALAAKVETILQNIAQHGQNGDQQIRQAIADMLGSAEGLKNAHAHAADQLNRLIPHIQDRAQGLAEIAHITGKQIGSTLQSLATSEIGLKANADNVKTTLIKLSSTADVLGERLFGAINLLQASGRVLAETTEDIKIRFTGEGQRIETPLVDLAPLSARLEDIAAQLGRMQTQIEAQRNSEPIAPTINIGEDMALLAARVEDSIANRLEPKFVALEHSLARSGGDNGMATNAALADIGAKMAALAENVNRLAAPGGLPAYAELGELMNNLWRQLAGQIEASRAGTDALIQQQIAGKLAAFEEKLDTTQRVAEGTYAEISKPSPPTIYTLPPELQKQMQDQWFQMSAQIEASRASLIDAIGVQIEKMESRIAGRNPSALSKTAAEYAAQRQIEQQTQILSELVSTLGILDAHMQQIKAEMHMVAAKQA